MSLPLLRPAWAMPPGVGAAMSLREGGVSDGAYTSLNLGVAVDDDAEAVVENRARFAAALGARPVWLRQVHGTMVLRLTAEAGDAADRPADAAWTDISGLACTVQVADCLPVLFALRDGRAVAAAHAGWRGLAAGVLEATVDALCSGAGAAPGDIQAWLGPCIGPAQFEVGADVLQAFGQHPDGPDAQLFVRRARPDGELRWLANLQRLAQGRLAAAGVLAVHATPACTVEDGSAFFSFRRDGVTGRMAAAIWRL
ncbi:MAG: peptidoglycan editing factor PgeF [Rubrivivax sp.]|nr:peptidoglycan editing factor PgeF [Rubrivivax sp.]